jgi:hypothetical protein
VPIEIRGKHVKGTRSIVNIRLAHTKADTEECYQLGYSLQKNLTVYGCKSSLWVIREQLLGDRNDDDGDLYPLGQIETMYWCDDRLIRCIKVFTLVSQSL